MRKINAKLLAGAMALAVASISTPPAFAQPALQFGVQVGFNEFYVALRPFGRWFHHPRWGDVWQPEVADFRPYSQGHWDYTDLYGWVWVSDYSWGDIPFHYGRWVYDPAYGWLWIPGYVWAPAWVLWRYGDGYVGWFPMPPDNEFPPAQKSIPPTGAMPIAPMDTWTGTGRITVRTGLQPTGCSSTQRILPIAIITVTPSIMARKPCGFSGRHATARITRHPTISS